MIFGLVGMAFIPQMLISIGMSINMTKIDELPDILFEEGLFERELGAKTEEQVLAWIIAMPFIAIFVGALTIYHYKRSMKNALEESMKMAFK